MCLNPFDEDIDRAYANVGLLASSTWSFQSDLDNYKQANLELWIRFNEIQTLLSSDETEDYQSTFTKDIAAAVPDWPFGEAKIGSELSHEDVDMKNVELWLLPEVEYAFNMICMGQLPRYHNLRQ